MRALLDGDIFVHRVGYTTNDAPVEIAYVRINEMIEQCLADVGAEEYFIFLSDATKNGFRYQLYPDYKANRKQPRPMHYQALKDYLVEHWGAIVAQGEEADDRLGIEQCRYQKEWLDANYLEHWESVICSIDKDLLQIPGHHYNFVNKAFTFVEPEQGTYFFYRQLLTGDVVDNIKGVTGIGPVKAEKALGLLGHTDEYGLFERVRELYRKEYKDDWERHMLLSGQLLKIRTREGEVWKFPEKQEQRNEDGREPAILQSE